MPLVGFTTVEAMLGIAVLVLLILVVWCLFEKFQAPSRRKLPATLPKGMVFEVQPYLTTGQAAFFNLLRLAVEDHYFVFAQVPLRNLVRVKALDTPHSSTSTSLVHRLLTHRVDFVLIHPGTLHPVKVIEFLSEGEEKELTSSPRYLLAQEVYHQTGIECVRINSHQTFTVQTLATHLEGEDQ